MKIVVAIDSFKGSCSAKEACEAIELGIKKVDKNSIVYQLPIADGGEGLINVLIENPLITNTDYRHYAVTGPYQQQINAGYLSINSQTAIIEMAQASGLELTPKAQRNALYATSFGVGELVKHALNDGFRHIIVGLGGSATNDGGVGFAQALGVKFYDKNRELIHSPACANDLIRIAYVDINDIHPAINLTNFEASCDVNNPLLGPNGATYIYGPQKTATPETLTILESNMTHYHNIVSASLNNYVNKQPGSGAAGGLGAALLWFTKAKLKPGIELVLSLIGAVDYIKDADLVITGEGRIDKQSSFGKAPVGVANLAALYNKPTVAIAGSLGDGANELYQHNINAMWSICNKPMTLDDAISNVKPLLTATAESLIRTICILKK